MTDKLRIVFVDDEPHVLRGLKRSMHEMVEVWDMAFFPSGAEALAWLNDHEADVLVSDMRMPHMDGAQFLDAARRRHPQTIRVILSGYAEAGAVLKTVDLAHIYLAKPCDPMTLAAAIARPLELRRFLADPGLRAAIGGLSSLPSLPARLRALMTELTRADASAASVADIIAGDLAMTAEILKLTNSAYFGIGQPVSSVLQAVRTLGLETIQTLVLKTAVFRRFSGSSQVAPFLNGLNRHGLSLSRLAKRIALAIGANNAVSEAASCAALLSSVGALVLLDCHGDSYLKVLTTVGPDRPVHMAEIAAYGVHHGHVGAYLLGLWGFRDDVVEAVAHAPAPGQAGHYDNLLLTVVHLAQALGPTFPPLPRDVPDIRHPDSDYLARVGLLPALPELSELAKTVAAEVSP